MIHIGLIFSKTQVSQHKELLIETDTTILDQYSQSKTNPLCDIVIMKNKCHIRFMIEQFNIKSLIFLFRFQSFVGMNKLMNLYALDSIKTSHKWQQTEDMKHNTPFDAIRYHISKDQ